MEKEDKRIMNLDDLEQVAGGTEPGDLTQEELIRLIEYYEHEKSTYLAKSHREPWEDQYLKQLEQRITFLSNTFAKRFDASPITSYSV